MIKQQENSLNPNNVVQVNHYDADERLKLVISDPSFNSIPFNLQTEVKNHFVNVTFENVIRELQKKYSFPIAVRGVVCSIDENHLSFETSRGEVLVLTPEQISKLGAEKTQDGDYMLILDIQDEDSIQVMIEHPMRMLQSLRQADEGKKDKIKPAFIVFDKSKLEHPSSDVSQRSEAYSMVSARKAMVEICVVDL